MQINTNHILSVIVFAIVLYFVFTEVRERA